MLAAATLAAAIFIAVAPVAHGASVGTLKPYRFLTQTAFDDFFTGNWPTCNSATCSALNGDAYTSDYAVAYFWQVTDATDGEVIQVNATEPNGTVINGDPLTYHATSNEPPWSEWTDPYGNVYYVPAGEGTFLTPIIISCGPNGPEPSGSWTLGFYDKGILFSSTPFTMSHNSPYLGITSPTENELFQLDQNDYTETDSIQFTASTNTGNPINWAVTLNYATSGWSDSPPVGASMSDGPRNFTGTSKTETYQSEGGQVKAITTTTAADRSTINDCVTFYVDGVQSPSPLDPTTQLLKLYSTGATPHLMTGLATHESGYSQFNYPGDGDPPQPDLYNGVQGLWPYESGGGGSHIGLMMVPTTGSDAWDWTQNTNDGVNSTTYGFVSEKLPVALLFSEWLTGAAKNKDIPINRAYRRCRRPNWRTWLWCSTVSQQNRDGPSSTMCRCAHHLARSARRVILGFATAPIGTGPPTTPTLVTQGPTKTCRRSTYSLRGRAVLSATDPDFSTSEMPPPTHGTTVTCNRASGTR